MSDYQEKDIFEYLDGTCSGSQKKDIEKALEEDDLFRNRFEQIQMVHHSLSQLSLDQAPQHLTDKVMQRIETMPSSAYYRSSSIFSGRTFLIISGVLTAIVAMITLFSTGYLNIDTLEPAAQGYEMTEEINFLKNLVTPKMLRNGMLVIYGVLSLALLDRAILNPLFRKRNKLTF